MAMLRLSAESRNGGFYVDRGAYRGHELGAVERVEMEFVDPALAQPATLQCGDIDRDRRAGFRIILEPLEAQREPFRNGRAAHRGEFLHLRKIGDRQDAGDDRNIDSGGARAIEQAEEGAVIEEELRDGTAGAGIDLALQIVEIGLGA